VGDLVYISVVRWRRCTAMHGRGLAPRRVPVTSWTFEHLVRSQSPGVAPSPAVDGVHDSFSSATYVQSHDQFTGDPVLGGASPVKNLRQTRAP